MSSLQILKRKSKEELLELIPITGELIELLVIEEFGLTPTEERTGPDAFFKELDDDVPVEIKSQTYLGSTLLNGQITYSKTKTKSPDNSHLSKQDDYVVVVGSCGISKETYYQFGFKFSDIDEEYRRKAPNSISVITFCWTSYWEANSFDVLWAAEPHILEANKSKFSGTFFRNLLVESEKQHKKILPLVDNK